MMYFVQIYYVFYPVECLRKGHKRTRTLHDAEYIYHLYGHV